MARRRKEDLGDKLIHDLEDKCEAYRGALIQWHEFQCGENSSWEECEACQAML